jgi:hypothetical protein
MNASIKKQALERLLEIVKELKPLESEANPLKRRPAGESFLHDSVWIYISDIGMEKHDALVACLFKNGLGNKFSEKYINDKLRSLYVRYVRISSDESLLKDFEGFLNDWELFAKEHLVVVPLAGIVLEDERLQLGNITLCRATPEYLKTKVLISGVELPGDLVNRAVQEVLKGRSET